VLREQLAQQALELLEQLACKVNKVLLELAQLDFLELLAQQV
jgi:hypothetical protein